MRPPAPPGGRPKAIAALLLWPVFFSLIAFGPIMMFVGAQDLYRHAADRPIECGGEVMPERGPHMCSTGHGPRTYGDLVRERREDAGRAPYFLAFGALAVGIGVPGIRRATRHLARVQRSF
ncbi:hypothetical protein GCM10023085_00850 [Actinomadura viridis]|uniref:Uncharacterized protein n=1 Tax=Actinomadura viridis TaxID=58110 RepID=A0A931GLA9_9ACTN|nr:hypothetical protein [Actinomadura viridis]MBG6090905.1 hypothetical protein [Actinomadura viridis]